MKHAPLRIAALVIALAFTVSCRDEAGPLEGIDFGMPAGRAREHLSARGIALQKCDGWYPRIDTYFCFIEKYGFPHVTAFLEFHEDRLYRVRFLLDDNNDPLRSHAAVFEKLRRRHGEPAESRTVVPPGYAMERWHDRHREIMKKGGYATARWDLADDRTLELKLYAGGYYFEIEWQYAHRKLFDEAEKFKKSIFMQR
jgi:hypothetical protein